MKNNARSIIEEIFTPADIRVNGTQPWDITVHDDAFYDRVLGHGILGLGESYMDGLWDVEQLDEFICRAIRVRGEARIARNWTNAFNVLRSKLMNLQTKARAQRVAHEHYNIGNDMYLAFLDPYNQYTCGYFKDTNDLNVAQQQKLDLISRKLQLKKGNRVLDIGCGWGGFAKWAAEHHGCHVTGASHSTEQIAFAKKFTTGLPVEIIHADYRDLTGTYDKILICGMIEHVGYRNYGTIMRKVRELLAPDGLFLLHTIGSNRSVTTNDPWSAKYIFPNSMAPSVAQLMRASEERFVLEDWHNFGPHYDPTLLAWWKNFDAAWPRFREQYGARFYRMFRFYLLGTAGAFRARELQLWQFVFSPHGVLDGYTALR